MKALVGEVGADVAGGAITLATKDLQAGLLLWRERAAVTVDKAVEAGIARKNRTDVTGKSRVRSLPRDNPTRRLTSVSVRFISRGS